MRNVIKGKIVKLLVEFFDTDIPRINHALEVLKYAETIAETLKNHFDRDVLIAAALLHDAGIKPSEEELGYHNGKTQEQYGPPVVREMLELIDFEPAKTDKVCEIVGNHHSPSKYDYKELEILKEADSIVNGQETANKK